MTSGLVKIFLNSSAGIKKYVVGLIIKTSSDPTCVEVSEFFQGKEREVNTMSNLTCIFHFLEREGVYWETEHDSCSGKLESTKSCPGVLGFAYVPKIWVFHFSDSETGMAKALANFYK